MSPLPSWSYITSMHSTYYVVWLTMSLLSPCISMVTCSTVSWVFLWDSGKWIDSNSLTASFCTEEVYQSMKIKKLERICANFIHYWCIGKSVWLEIRRSQLDPKFSFRIMFLSFSSLLLTSTFTRPLVVSFHYLVKLPCYTTDSLLWRQRPVLDTWGS